jgi:hypothetical protein
MNVDNKLRGRSRLGSTVCQSITYKVIYLTFLIEGTWITLCNKQKNTEKEIPNLS